MNSKEKFDLITRNLQEIITRDELKSLLNKNKDISVKKLIMKGIFVSYNLDKDDWTDEEYENQEEREIFIPIYVIRDYIREASNLAPIEYVDIISRVKEVY